MSYHQVFNESLSVLAKLGSVFVNFSLSQNDNRFFIAFALNARQTRLCPCDLYQLEQRFQPTLVCNIGQPPNCIAIQFSASTLNKATSKVRLEVNYADEERSLNWAEKPFKLEDIWRIRIRLEIEGNIMELALLNLAIDCKLRSCDLLRMKVRDISSSGVIQDRVLYSQSKTGREVQFEITSRTAQSLTQWLIHSQLSPQDYLFPSPRKQAREGNEL